MSLGSLAECVCRKAATDLLESFFVEAPEEIDLTELAWLAGRLRIEEGVVGAADGRLVASENGGVIRIGRNAQPEGRRRFTIAHEIGHRCLHGPCVCSDQVTELRTWKAQSKETEANVFASELLMPARLFAPLVPREEPSLRFIDSLAQVFRSSNLAAAVHFISHTKEPCALVACCAQRIQWIRMSRSFEFPVRRDGLHKHTGASEIAANPMCIPPGMTRTPAGAWLEGFDPEEPVYVWEDTRRLDAYDLTVSLLWIKDEL